MITTASAATIAAQSVRPPRPDLAAIPGGPRPDYAASRPELVSRASTALPRRLATVTG